jgi:sulfite exporter TauE/SafE
MKKKIGLKSVLTLLVVSVVIVLCIIYAKPNEAIEVYYIHNNPCESCREYLHFLQEFEEQVSDEVPSSEYHIQELYLLREEALDTYHKLMEELEIPIEDRSTPMLIIGKQYLVGSDSINENSKKLLMQELGRTKDTSFVLTRSSEEGSMVSTEDIHKVPGIEVGITDSYLLYFSTSACESCESVDTFLNSLPEFFEVIQTGNNISSKLVIEKRNILEEGNLTLYQKLLTKYSVPEDDRVVPLLFFQSGYLSGEEAITAGLNDVITIGKALNFSGDFTSTASKAAVLSFKDIPKMLVAGLLNGFNPCSFSMLFLLLSLILAKKENVLKLGLVYLASKLLAYLAIGVSLYYILGVLESGLLPSLRAIIRIILIIAAFLLAAVNFVDFINARNEHYDKLWLKLPKKLRNADHNIMKKLINNNKKHLWIMVFILGFLISAGEFLCTGQVYLATILTMIQVGSGDGTVSNLLLLIYILMMLLPSFCVVILVHRGKKLYFLSDYVVRHTDLIKFVNMLIFIVMGFILLFF